MSIEHQPQVASGRGELHEGASDTTLRENQPLNLPAVLTLRDLCTVYHISPATYYRHARLFEPFRVKPRMGVLRFSGAAVERELRNPSTTGRVFGRRLR
jgi:hypothetical protein